MTFQLLHSEFPYIWGKFDFLFYQCSTHSFYRVSTGSPPLLCSSWTRKTPSGVSSTLLNSWCLLSITANSWSGPKSIRYQTYISSFSQLLKKWPYIEKLIYIHRTDFGEFRWNNRKVVSILFRVRIRFLRIRTPIQAFDSWRYEMSSPCVHTMFFRLKVKLEHSLVKCLNRLKAALIYVSHS